MYGIELIESLRRAYRWIGDKALPIPYEDGVSRIERGLDRRVYS